MAAFGVFIVAFRGVCTAYTYIIYVYICCMHNVAQWGTPNATKLPFFGGQHLDTSEAQLEFVASSDSSHSLQR